jgi:ATP-dependent Zn protease
MTPGYERPPLQCTAYHEAGHAVMAYRLGYPIKKVTIVKRQGVLGKVEVRNQGSPDDIRIDLAGQLAEALVNSNDVQLQVGSRSDWRNARRSAREFVELGFIGDGEKGTLIEELLHETRALVHRDREAIAAVAEALLEHKTLTGADITQIMEAAR